MALQHAICPLSHRKIPHYFCNHRFFSVPSNCKYSIDTCHRGLCSMGLTQDRVIGTILWGLFLSTVFQNISLFIYQNTFLILFGLNFIIESEVLINNASCVWNLLRHFDACNKSLIL